MTGEQLKEIKTRILAEENSKFLSALPPEFIILICCSRDTSVQDIWMDYYINRRPLQLTICWLLDRIWWGYPDQHEGMSVLWPVIQPVLAKADYTTVRTVQMGDYNPERTQLDCLTYLYGGLESQLTMPRWTSDDQARIQAALLQLLDLHDYKPATIFKFMSEHWQYLSYTLHPEHVYEALLLTTTPIIDTPEIRRKIRHSVNSYIKQNHKSK